MVPKLRMLQARLMLSQHKRVSEAEVIERAIDVLVERESKEVNPAGYGLEKMFGIGKSKVKGDVTADVDKVVYGL